MTTFARLPRVWWKPQKPSKLSLAEICGHWESCCVWFLAHYQSCRLLKSISDHVYSLSEGAVNNPGCYLTVAGYKLPELDKFRCLPRKLAPLSEGVADPPTTTISLQKKLHSRLGHLDHCLNTYELVPKDHYGAQRQRLITTIWASTAFAIILIHSTIGERHSVNTCLASSHGVDLTARLRVIP